MLLEAPLQEEY